MSSLPSAADLGLLFLLLIGLSVFLRMLNPQRRKMGLLALSFTGLAAFAFCVKGAEFAALLLSGSLVYWLANAALAFVIQKNILARRKIWFAVGVALNIFALATLHFCDSVTASTIWPWQEGKDNLSLLYFLGAPLLLLNALSYLWDVRRGRIEPSLLDCGLHLFYLPKMLAGPVLSPRPFARALTRQPSVWESINNYGYGFLYIGLGLFSAEVVCPFIIGLIAPVLEASAAQTVFGRTDALAALFGLGLASFFALAGMASMGRGVSLLFGVALPGGMRAPLNATTVLDLSNRWLVGVAFLLRRLILSPLRGAPAVQRISAVALCGLSCGLLFGVSANHFLLGCFLAVIFLLSLVWRQVVAPRLPRFVKSPQSAAQDALTRTAALSLVFLLLMPRSLISFVALIVVTGAWYGFMKTTKQTSWADVFRTFGRWIAQFLAHLATLAALSVSTMFLAAPNMVALRSLFTALFCSTGLSLPAALGSLVRLYKQTWIGMVFPINPTLSSNVLFYNQGTGVLSLVFLFVLTLYVQKRPTLTSRECVVWHSVGFGIAVYFLAAWFFVGPAPLWPGLWR